jgi:RNA polymerase sigma-70 factor (ECF subfamily)
MELVLARVRPVVLRYCRARLGPGPAADDIAQEVCLALMAALPCYRERGKPFLSFVYGIATHKLTDARRAAAREHSDPVWEVPEPSGTAGGRRPRCWPPSPPGGQNGYWPCSLPNNARS